MNQRNLLYAGILLLGAVIGAMASGTLSGGDDEATPTAQRSPATVPARFEQSTAGNDGTVADMLESLSLALTQESEYRLVLEEQIAELNERVDELQARLGDDRTTSRVASVRGFEARRRGANGPLNVERMVAAGMAESDARALKAKLDDIAMQRLYLRDQAQREGWMGDQRYREEAQRLAAAQGNIRNEFGDDAYDRYLYASGRPNRVQIESVLDNSPAYEAGLRIGDQILSYSDSRTYAANELRRATQQGSAGEMVPMRVMRNGETLEIYVPRGPLGVQMSGVSSKP